MFLSLKVSLKFFLRLLLNWKVTGNHFLHREPT